MEIIAVIVVGALIFRFLGGGGGSDSNNDGSSYKTKANDGEMRIRHLINEQRDREREAAAQRRNNR